MSVKLTRYVFRKINGRIIPIRVGAKESVDAVKGISSKAMKKANLLIKEGFAKVKSSKLVSAEEPSSSELMMKFVKKTGTVRFHKSNDSINIDFTSKLTSEQKMKLAEAASKNDEVFVDTPKGSGSFKSLTEFIRSPLNWNQKDFRSTKIAKKLENKAIDDLGLTDDFREAGFINRNGEMIDLSGKRQGGESGVRHLDHREVSGYVKIEPKKLKQSDLRWLVKKAQYQRKNKSARLHEIQSLKTDIKKIEAARLDFDDQNDYIEILKSMNKKLKFAIERKRNRVKK